MNNIAAVDSAMLELSRSADRSSTLATSSQFPDVGLTPTAGTSLVTRVIYRHHIDYRLAVSNAPCTHSSLIDAPSFTYLHDRDAGSFQNQFGFR
jgi:hypothetical protein